MISCIPTWAHHRLPLAIIIFAAATFTTGIGYAATLALTTPSSVLPGEYLVRRAPGQSTAQLLADLSQKLKGRVDLVDEIPERELVDVLVTPQVRAQAPGLLAAQMTSETADAATLQSVESIEPVIRFHLTQSPTDIGRTSQSLSQLMKRIKFTPVKNSKPLATTAPYIVAVIDNGVFLDHEVFKGLLLPGTDVTSAQPAATAAALPLPSGGIEFHGTNTAGLIALMIRGGTIDGPALANIKILPIRATSPDQTIKSPAAIKAIAYAVSHGAKLINASWGEATESKEVMRALMDAGNAHVLVVASAGNGRSASPVDPFIGYDIDSTPFYPASWQLPNLISVAAVGLTSSLASFSNWGKATVALAAPGDSIYVPMPDPGGNPPTTRSGYRAQSGTSISAPLVSGAAALYGAMHIAALPEETAARLSQSANKQAELASRVTSGGILSVDDLLIQANKPIQVASGKKPPPTQFANFLISPSMLESFSVLPTAPPDAAILKGRDANGAHISTPNEVDLTVRLVPGTAPQKAWAKLSPAQGTVNAVEGLTPNLYSVKIDAPAGASTIQRVLKLIPGVESVEAVSSFQLQEK